MSRPVERRSRVVEINTRKRGGEAVRVALPADLSVGDDVEARFFLRLDGQHRSIILSLRQERLRNPPQLTHADPRREAPGQFLAVDQPIRLWIASYERRREKHVASPRFEVGR